MIKGSFIHSDFEAIQRYLYLKSKIKPICLEAGTKMQEFTLNTL